MSNPYRIDNFDEFSLVEITEKVLRNFDWTDENPSNLLSRQSMQPRLHLVGEDNDEYFEVNLNGFAKKVSPHWYYAVLRVLDLFYPYGVIGTQEQVLAFLEKALTMPAFERPPYDDGTVPPPAHPLVIDTLEEISAADLLGRILANFDYETPDVDNPLCRGRLNAGVRVEYPLEGEPVEYAKFDIWDDEYRTNIEWYFGALRAIDLLVPSGLAGNEDDIIDLLERAMTMPVIEADEDGDPFAPGASVAGVPEESSPQDTTALDMATTAAVILTSRDEPDTSYSSPDSSSFDCDATTVDPSPDCQ